MKDSSLLYTGLAALALLPVSNNSSAQGRPSKPNIIFIMADDLGYGDIACYGSKYIRTPNIDRMAQEGIRFTQHYSSAPVSAPARCCLMTGKHLGHSYVRNNFEIKSENPAEQGQMPLPENTETVAKMLKRAGYSTAIIGKWGLGSMNSTGAPGKQGFDFFYGYNDQNHAHNHYPSFLWRNDKMEKLDNPEFTVHPKFDRNAPHGPDEYKEYQGNAYSLDLMSDEALKYIEQNKNNPFFLYLAVVVPHKAMQVPDESLEMYNGVFNEKPYTGGGGYTPHPRPNSAYAAMISRMDQKVGLILSKLRELGIEKNTIVVFTSDNGPAEGGGTDSGFFNSSGGLKGSKSQVYEGGIREPFVVWWPGKIKPGSVTDLVSAHYDFMATATEIAGQKPIQTDGVSYLPTLLGRHRKQKQHEYLYWEFGGQLAVRMGNLKGVKRVLRNPQPKWEIYDLSNDPGETTDVSEKYTDLAGKFDEIVNMRTPSHHEPWNFMTSDPLKSAQTVATTFSFAFITDIHLEYNSTALDDFRRAADRLNSIKPDFVLTGGDNIRDARRGRESYADSLYNLYKSEIKKLEMPVYTGFGNHESFGVDNPRALPQSPSYGKNMFREKIGPTYYSFVHKGWKFFMLDNVFDTLSGGYRYIGRIDKAQMKWIEKELESTDKEMPVVICSHIPFVSSMKKFELGSLSGNPVNDGVENSIAFFSLFRNHNIKLMLQGHFHFFEVLYANNAYYITGPSPNRRFGNPTSAKFGMFLFKTENDSLTWKFIEN